MVNQATKEAIDISISMGIFRQVGFVPGQGDRKP
jgi:hypothetical protein